MCFYIDLSGVKTQDKARMDAKRKEMDLLSNSIAAYAHIKGFIFIIISCSSSHNREMSYATIIYATINWYTLYVILSFLFISFR